VLSARQAARLAGLVSGKDDDALENLGHSFSEMASKKLKKEHPGTAARLWQAQGFRIVNAKKSKCYDAAVANFEQAKKCYKKAELVEDWEKTVAKVRVGHFRKRGFMVDFEKIVSDEKPRAQPSFMERAESRWNKNVKGDD